MVKYRIEMSSSKPNRLQPMKYGHFKVRVVSVGHRHLQDTCPTCIGHSKAVSDFKKS